MSKWPATFSLLFIFCLWANAQDTTQFNVNGKHHFEKKQARTWSLSREEIDQLNGNSVLKRDIDSANGEKVRFKLKQSGKKETIYYVTAKGPGFSETRAIRIFKPNKLTSFVFKSKSGHQIQTYIFVPKTLSPKTRLLFVMHGMKRRPEKYIATWERWAKKNDYILVGPKFDEKKWVRARSYNFGNVFTGNEGRGKVNPRVRWSYEIVEEIHRRIRSGFALENPGFDIYGHSAGAQFIHRFTLFVPNSQVRIAISANSGWYTLPNLEEKFPYGLKHPKFKVTEKDVLEWSKKRLVILRGTYDLKRSAQVRKTKKADEQGTNRFARAGYMFDQMKSRHPETNWQLVDVPRVAHIQRKMAAAAQKYLEVVNSSSNQRGGSND